jgi:hypothetical protein
MIRDLVAFLDIHFRRTFAAFVERIREINTKYAHPRIAVTPAAAVALLILRLYLLALVGILMFKFWTMIR